MGYGVLALHALGDQYLPYAVLAGLYSGIVVPLTALALGGRSPLMYAPRSVVAFLLGAIVPGLAAGPGAGAAGSDPLLLVFFLVLIAGLFQALFGLLRVGALIKYIPSPVMAGFQNAVALLILAAQLNPLLGLPGHVPLLDLGRHLPAAQPLTLLVGLLTCLVIWRLPAVAPRVPAVPVGLVAGVALYYALVLLGLGGRLGPVVGAGPLTGLRLTQAAGFLDLLGSAAAWSLLPAVAGAAVSLAIVASLDALLCAKLVEGVTGRRTDGSRALLRLGLGNVAAAGLGVLPAGVNLGASFANHRAGGRTAASVAVAAVATLAVALFLAPVVGHLPRVVIAAILVVVAFQLVDRWSLRLARELTAGRTAGWRMPAFDLLTVVLVGTVTIALNLVAAVAVGVAVAAASFLLRMSRSVVRRSYRADAVRSKRARDPRLSDFLAVEGRRIVVFELQGPIFFGTAEDLAGQVEAAARDGAACVILDLKRVNDIDSTGARIILQIHGGLQREARRLLLSHADEAPVVAAGLAAAGVGKALGPAALFTDTDAALEQAEDLLIRSHLGAAAAAEEVPVHRLPVLEGLTGEQCAVVERLLVRRAYPAGTVIVKEGERDRSLFMLASGTASVKIALGGPDRSKRLATFSPGTVFGEVALFDNQPRSATVTADQDAVCYVLPEESFRALTEAHPAIAIQLLTTLGRELSRRLRRSTATIAQLES